MKGKAPTNLECALLGLLHGQPQSGYDLRKIFATTAMGNYSSSPGAIYPALKRLEARGLVTSEIDSTNEMRPRKVLTPTARGKTLFRDWLRADFSAEDIDRRFDQLMLKFAFHWVLDDLGESHDFLAALASGLDVSVRSLEAQRNMFPEQMPIQPRLALDQGIGQTKAAARWARKALSQIKEEMS